MPPMDFIVTVVIVLLSMALGIVGARGMLQLAFAAMARPGTSQAGSGNSQPRTEAA